MIWRSEQPLIIQVKVSDTIKDDTQGRCMNLSRDRWHANNRSNYGSFLPKLLHDYLRPSISSAKDQIDLCKSGNTFDFSPDSKVPPNSNNYKTFLCDYFYKGERWSLEIKALSHKEAEERLRNVANGEVMGELIISIPISPEQNWLTKLKKYLRLI